MPKQKVINVITYGILALAGGISFTLPNGLPVTGAAAPANPNTIDVTGIIRDFKTTHPDFTGTPSNGLGHTGENVNSMLPGTNVPVFAAGTGYKVATEWKDSSARNIAPSMYQRRGGVKPGERLGIRINADIDIKHKDSSIDAFNSDYGLYGFSGNYGARALMSTNSVAKKAIDISKDATVRSDVYVGPGGNPATVIAGNGLILGKQGILTTAYDMPDLLMPDDTAGYVATKNITTATTLTGDTNPEDDNDVDALYYGALSIKSGAVVTIVGNLRIRCDTSLTIDSGAQIVLSPDAQLTIFVNGDIKIKGQSLVNTSTDGDSSTVVINNLSNKDVEIDGKSFVYATIIAPLAKLKVHGESQLYGGVIANKLELDDKTGIHVDQSDATLGRWNFALSVRDKIEFEDHVTLDSFDSNNGAYGGANVAKAALMCTNSTKSKKVTAKNQSTIFSTILVGPKSSPTSVINADNTSSFTGAKGNLNEPMAIPIIAPPALGASVGDKTYPANTTSTLSSNLHCKKLKLDNKAILQISGNVVIRADDTVEITSKSEIRLMANSTLKLFVNKRVKVDDQSAINLNTGNPQLCSIYRTSTGGGGKIDVTKLSSVVAWIQGAKTDLHLEDHADFYGSFIGQNFRAKKQSTVHVDMANLNTCVNVNDTAGTAGSASNGDIASASSFDQWFKDNPTVNQTAANVITMTKNGSGVYEYLNDNFYPIDGKLQGNQGSHNTQFTFTITADFVYTQCGGQFVEFTGGDGCWMFVNGLMAMDLGGMGSANSQYVDFDRLGLSDGESYRIDFFYAQRRSNASVFRLRTNISLSTQAILPTVTSAYD